MVADAHDLERPVPPSGIVSPQLHEDRGLERSGLGRRAVSLKSALTLRLVTNENEVRQRAAAA